MFLKKPSNDKSVSLTLAIVSFVLFAGFSVAESLGYVENSGSLAELFYACAALYFGRRATGIVPMLNIKNTRKRTK